MLATLSVATDLGMGQHPEKAVRSCLIATGLGRALDLPEEEVHEVYFASLMRHLGCTATALLEARFFGGDELMSRRAFEPTDFGNRGEMLTLTLGTGRGSAPRRPLLVGGRWWAISPWTRNHRICGEAARCSPSASGSAIESPARSPSSSNAGTARANPTVYRVRRSCFRRESARSQPRPCCSTRGVVSRSPCRW